MIDPVIDAKLKKKDFKVYRPEISDSDKKIIQLAEGKESPILKRDRDFVEKHRKGEKHFGIIFDPGMHHRTLHETVEAINSVFELMSRKDLKNAVIRLKRFY